MTGRSVNCLINDRVAVDTGIDHEYPFGMIAHFL